MRKILVYVIKMQTEADTSEIFKNFYTIRNFINDVANPKMMKSES